MRVKGAGPKGDSATLEVSNASKAIVRVGNAGKPMVMDMIPVRHDLVPVSHQLVPFTTEHFHEAVVGLRTRGFTVEVAESRDEVSEYVHAAFDVAGSVAVGGIHTVRSLGIGEELAKRDFDVLDHWSVRGRSNAMDVRRKQLWADYYLGSVDAVTLNGELVVRDGVGNRLAGLSFGPRRAVVVIGMNKIVADLPAAFARLEALSVHRRASAIRSKESQPPNFSAARYREDVGSAATLILHCPPVFADLRVVLLHESIGL